MSAFLTVTADFGQRGIHLTQLTTIGRAPGTQPVSCLNLPALTKDEIMYYDQKWERLVISRMRFRPGVAYRGRRAYRELFLEEKRLPKVRAFLDHNRYGNQARRLVGRALGF